MLLARREQNLNYLQHVDRIDVTFKTQIVRKHEQYLYHLQDM